MNLPNTINWICATISFVFVCQMMKRPRFLYNWLARRRWHRMNGAELLGRGSKFELTGQVLTVDVPFHYDMDYSLTLNKLMGDRSRITAWTGMDESQYIVWVEPALLDLVKTYINLRA